MRKSLLLLVLLCGCATHPITGRNQLQALPALQAAYADARFVMSTEAWRIAAPLSCDEDCGDAERRKDFVRRVAQIGAELETVAKEMSPELAGRIGNFRIEVSDVLGVVTGSSAGGRIVMGSGLAGLQPSNTVLAFLIAREMAHVIARHEEENSGASILFSILGFLLPGFHVLARLGATTLGSGVLMSSWAAEQQREGDEIAIALLERAGVAASLIAIELASGIRRAKLPEGDWGARYLESAQHVARIADLRGLRLTSGP